MISFKMQDSPMQTHTPGAWGKCCLCFTTGSAPTCLLVFLGLERVFFTGSRREGAIRLFSRRKPHRSMALVLIESQVLVKGVMLRQVLF